MFLRFVKHLICLVLLLFKACSFYKYYIFYYPFPTLIFLWKSAIPPLRHYICPLAPIWCFSCCICFIVSIILALLHFLSFRFASSLCSEFNPSCLYAWILFLVHSSKFICRIICIFFHISFITCLFAIISISAFVAKRFPCLLLWFWVKNMLNWNYATFLYLFLPLFLFYNFLYPV